MKVILSQPRGFCAGVVRPINIIESASNAFGHPVYTESPEDSGPAWRTGARTVGGAFGVSTTESLVDAVLDRLGGLGASSIEKMDGLRETTVFPLPLVLSRHASASHT